MLMGTNRVKMVAENGRPSLETSIRGSVYPFFSVGSAIRSLLLLMPISWKKFAPPPKYFFGSAPAGRDAFRLGYKLAFISPNAHRLGKNERTTPKNPSPA